jgi:hypothetical protein
MRLLQSLQLLTPTIFISACGKTMQTEIGCHVCARVGETFDSVHKIVPQSHPGGYVSLPAKFARRSLASPSGGSIAGSGISVARNDSQDVLVRNIVGSEDTLLTAPSPMTSITDVPSTLVSIRFFRVCII